MPALMLLARLHVYFRPSPTRRDDFTASTSLWGSSQWSSTLLNEPQRAARCSALTAGTGPTPDSQAHHCINVTCEMPAGTSQINDPAGANELVIGKAGSSQGPFSTLPYFELTALF
ncbi:hypothetical protein [Paraburkholderia franconis]|uniref:hypothetical protein n=1 Tax=Paraburkholderia franconis TaxID=2654983 RepID=UPI00187B2687|nr:hypothetical protein [Paraburkholderia franconis]